MHKIEIFWDQNQNKQKCNKLNTRATTYKEVKKSYTQNMTDKQEREDKTQKDNLHLIKT